MWSVQLVVVGDNNIVNMWCSHFQNLLNTFSITSFNSFVHMLATARTCMFSVDEVCDKVCKAIQMSKSGKAPDHHGVIGEH